MSKYKLVPVGAPGDVMRFALPEMVNWYENTSLGNNPAFRYYDLGKKALLSAAAPQPAEQQPAPDVKALVEALEAALMVMTSKEVSLEKQADAITIARAALAAYHKQGGES